MGFGAGVGVRVGICRVFLGLGSAHFFGPSDGGGAGDGRGVGVCIRGMMRGGTDAFSNGSSSGGRMVGVGMGTGVVMGTNLSDMGQWLIVCLPAADQKRGARGPSQ